MDFFCPFRSTAEKEIKCSPNCALYVNNDEPCAIYSLAVTLDTTNKKLDNIDYDIRNP